ncbi:hypothetical protein KU599_07310 [Salmonella enterica subsp. enterica serovar Mbandaka]|nr:hypothetical protein [Salmonella enterica subsp. enterica serovar Mbandaka]
MAHYGVYTYPTNNEVALGNFNLPFNQEKVVIYRGANNSLSFSVHNADGKYTLLRDDEYLIFAIFDARNNTKIYDVLLEKILPSWVSEAGQARPTLSNKKKVYYGCVVPAGVIQDLSPGSKYRWTIHKVRLNGDLVEPTEFLYTGLGFEASAELIISDQAAPVFVASQEISAEKNSSWLPIAHKSEQPIANGVKGDYEVLHSSAIRAGCQYGLVEGLSTIAFYFQNFIGRIQLQGCLANNSPNDNEEYKWFIINLDGKEYIESGWDEHGAPKSIDGIQAFNFKGNYMWVRAVCCIPPLVRHYEPNEVVKYYEPLKTVPKILIRR